MNECIIKFDGKDGRKVMITAKEARRRTSIARLEFIKNFYNNRFGEDDTATGIYIETIEDMIKEFNKLKEGAGLNECIR